MSPRRSFFVFACILLFAGAALQQGELLVAFGVKPNLILAFLAAFSFFIPAPVPYALLALLGAFLVGFAPGFNWESAALLAVVLLFFYVRDRFLSAGPLALALFIALGTALFYLLISPAFLYHGMWTVAREAAYNVLVGIALFALLSLFYEKKDRTTIR